MPYYIYLSCLHRLCLAVTVSQTCLVFDDLGSLRSTVQVFCRMPHYWNLSSVFLWLDWRRQWHPTPVLLLGKSHGQRSLLGCNPWGRTELDTTELLHFHFSLSCIGEGNGSPLQCSCLEKPRDGGAWWAAIYGVAQSQTRLKWLSISLIRMGLWIWGRKIGKVQCYFHHIIKRHILSMWFMVNMMLTLISWFKQSLSVSHCGVSSPPLLFLWKKLLCMVHT